jgi:Flp pilus assembly protein TadG
MEFALLLPFLAVVVFGTIDAARAYTLKTSLSNMAGQGAELARSKPFNVAACAAPEPSITTVAQNEDSTVSGSTVTVERLDTVTNAWTAVTNSCGTPRPAGTRIRVKVSAPMTMLTPFVGVANNGVIKIGGTVEVLTPQG